MAESSYPLNRPGLRFRLRNGPVDRRLSLTRKITLLNFTPDRAAHALNVLIADGKIAAGDVTNALKRREQLIRDLRRRLVALEHGAVSAVERSSKTVARKVTGRPKRKMSGARRAALKLHGQYLGHIRTLPKAAKAKIKVIREAKGVHAAIKAARTMAKPALPRPKWGGVQARQPDYQGPQQRKAVAYLQRERPKPDKHGGSGAGRQQGGSGAGRERS
jgi:hypothetical protein